MFMLYVVYGLSYMVCTYMFCIFCVVYYVAAVEENMKYCCLSFCIMYMEPFLPNDVSWKHTMSNR